MRTQFRRICREVYIAVVFINDLRERVEATREIADKRNVRISILTDKKIVHLQLNDLRVSRDTLSESHPEIQHTTRQNNHIAVLDRVAPRAVEQQLRISRKRTATHSICIRRDFRLVQKRLHT